MEYSLRLDEGSFLIYIEETGELYIGYDDGDYSLVFETQNSLAGLTYFEFNETTTTRDTGDGVAITGAPSKEAAEQSYINQLASLGLAQIISTKDEFYSSKGTGDLQNFVFVDYSYSNLDSAITQHGSKAIDRFKRQLDAKATNAPWWQDAGYKAEAAEWYRKYGSEGYQLWLDSTHDQWLEDNGFDPRTYEAWKEYSNSETKWNDKIADYKQQLQDSIDSKGGSVSDKALEYAANEWAWGRWNFLKAKTQVQLAIDPGAKGEKDAGFFGYIEDDDITETTLQEAEVKFDIEKYLPTALQGQYNIKEIAAKYRNNFDFRNTFIEQLKNDRYAMYSQYDKNLDWSTIVRGKKATASSVWGIDMNTIKDDDAAIMQMLTDNDPSKEAEYLRGVGMERGYTKIMNDFTKAFASSYGTGVVRSAGFRER